MKARQFTYGTNVILFIILVAGILFAINIISTRLFLRFDLTENKEFTLSDSTKKLAKGIEDLIIIKVYMSEELPPPWYQARREVEDFLADFASYARGYLRISWVDPGDDQELTQKIESQGIPKFPVGSSGRDMIGVQAIFFGMAIGYLDKQHTIPQINPYTLEYDLAAGLLKLTRSQESVVGLITGEAPTEPMNPMAPPPGTEQYQILMRELGKQHEIRPVTLDGGSRPVPPEISTLILAGPRAVTDREKYEIDQFVMRGGNLVALVDPISLDDRTLSATAIDSHLDDLIASYGIRLSSNLVVEAVKHSAIAGWRTQYGFFRSPYPFWVQIQGEQLNSENPVVNRIGSITLPWSGHLNLEQAVLGESIAATILATSSDQAQLTPDGVYDIMPKMNQTPPTTEGNPAKRNLIAVLRGQFKSFYSGKEAPPRPQAPGAPALDNATDQAQVIQTSSETTVVVIPNSLSIKDQMIQSLGANNVIFFLNLIDWISFGDDLIGIRTRPVTERSLGEISDVRKNFLKYANLLGISAFVIIFGLLRYSLRRSN